MVPSLNRSPYQALICQPAICNRLQVIAQALNAPATEVESVAYFMEWLLRSRRIDEQLILICFQLFLARIPAINELTDIATKVRNSSAAELLHFFVGSAEFLKGKQSRVYFRSIEPDKLLIDVTHTLTFPHNSGIQRVVRCLGRELNDGYHDHQLIEFDYDLQIYRLVSKERSRLLLDWEKIVDRSAGTVDSIGNRFEKRFWKIAGKRFRKIAAKINRERVAKYDSQLAHASPKAEKQVEDAVFIWEHKLLLPEVALEHSRQLCLSSVLASTPCSSTIVVYDFIPLHHPEYCTVTEGFIRYLAFLRHFDQASCISNAVENDLISYMHLVDRSKPPIKHATHYLGGDFETHNINSSSEEPEIPIVLTVGSIEMRKNHRRILSAMVEAQKSGCRFKGVFAGNPGWLNEDFLAELAKYQAQGYKVELESSVSEERLEQLYRMASFTLYCSLVEGFGLPIVESVVKGVPCIVSEKGCMKEIAEQIGGCRFVDPTSVDNITTAIVNLLTNPAELDELRSQARKASWRNWSVYASELWSFCNSFEQSSQNGEASAA